MGRAKEGTQVQWQHYHHDCSRRAYVDQSTVGEGGRKETTRQGLAHLMPDNRSFVFEPQWVIDSTDNAPNPNNTGVARRPDIRHCPACMEYFWFNHAKDEQEWIKISKAEAMKKMQDGEVYNG